MANLALYEQHCDLALLVSFSIKVMLDKSEYYHFTPICMDSIGGSCFPVLPIHTFACLYVGNGTTIGHRNSSPVNAMNTFPFLMLNHSKCLYCLIRPVITVWVLPHHKWATLCPVAYNPHLLYAHAPNICTSGTGEDTIRVVYSQYNMSIVIVENTTSQGGGKKAFDSYIVTLRWIAANLRELPIPNWAACTDQCLSITKRWRSVGIRHSAWMQFRALLQARAFPQEYTTAEQRWKKANLFDMRNVGVATPTLDAWSGKDV
eukprot:Gb_08655 [translate_table: standard]